MATKSISQLDIAVSLALGDLFEIAEPDVQSQTGYASKKISMSQAATYVQEDVSNANLNTTDKTLVGAINEVDSEGVKWSENNILGAKNLLKYPYYRNSQVISGITWTVNSDGTVTATGTATANSDFSLHTREFGELNDLILPNGTYILSDGGVGNSNIRCRLAITKNGSYMQLATTENGEMSFTANGDDYSSNSISPTVYLSIASGQQNVNVTFKPMIRLASIADNTFEPFAQTNAELTAEKMAWNKYAEYGVKNLIPYPWQCANGRVNRGITFGVDAEGYVTFDGTASTTQEPFFSFTNTAAADVAEGKFLKVSSGVKYRISIDRTDEKIWGIGYVRNLDGTNVTDVGIFVKFDDGTEEMKTSNVNTRSGGVNHKSLEFVISKSGDYLLQLDVRVSANTGTYYPSTSKARMIFTMSEITDLSWMPYAMSNYELTLNKMDVVNIAPIEEGNSASQAYAVGDYMIWKRRFYKVTAAISSGGAITEGTNVTQTTIGAELKAALT